jgi:hypothetical protein
MDFFMSDLRKFVESVVDHLLPTIASDIVSGHSASSTMETHRNNPSLSLKNAVTTRLEEA